MKNTIRGGLSRKSVNHITAIVSAGFEIAAKESIISKRQVSLYWSLNQLYEIILENIFTVTNLVAVAERWDEISIYFNFKNYEETIYKKT